MNPSSQPTKFSLTTDKRILSIVAFILALASLFLGLFAAVPSNFSKPLFLATVLAVVLATVFAAVTFRLVLSQITLLIVAIYIAAGFIITYQIHQRHLNELEAILRE